MKFTESSHYRILAVVAASDRGRPNPLLQKLHAFGKLENGWSHGEGVPVVEDTIRIAEVFVETATRLQLKADVFPGLHGDCAVAFYQGSKSVEVIVHPGCADRFGLHVEEGSGFQFKTVVEKDDASHAEVVAQITQLITDTWKSLESSRSDNSMSSSVAFPTLSSNTLQESPMTHLMGS